MSVTITANPTMTQLHRTLHDYTIHLTGVGDAPEPVNPREGPAVENPANWPQNYHNIPSYRAIDPNLDMEERPGGTNPVERAFIFIMLHGVWLSATVAQTWHKTGGRVNDTFFMYKIGGEW